MPFELCSPKLIDAVVAEVFDGPLAEAGFQKIRERFYVRSRFAEMNDVIEFWRDKLNLNFLWGLSLNFVPHITSGLGIVRWHRTPKSAYRDLSYSGFGRNPKLGWSIKCTGGEIILRQSALLTRSEMLPQALEFFESLKSPHDLEAVFSAFGQKENRDFGWTFDMFPQASLAYSFYLAKSGQEEKAREFMSRWITRNAVAYREETTAKLSRMFEEAARTPFV